MLDLGTGLTIGGAPPPIISPLPGPVMHHVDSVFINLFDAFKNNTLFIVARRAGNLDGRSKHRFF